MLARVGLAEAERILGDAPDVRAWLGDEGAVLRWAAVLAERIGWRSLLPRLVRWNLPTGALPWAAEVTRAVDVLAPAEAALLRVLASCDAPFAWEVLEAVATDDSATVDIVIALENAGLLERQAREGVVTFCVPYSVRAVVRDATVADRWLDAWTKRALEIRAASYGPDARAALAELGAALPLAVQALASEENAGRGLALWLAASDALFFGDSALPYDAPAFARAVEVADASAIAQAHARVIAGRALLERGDAVAALGLLREATDASSGVSAEAYRGIGWASLALAQLDDARAAFEAARTFDDPRTQADAAAGLGIHALLAGDAPRAAAHLEEALAIHVVMRDAPREAAVRGMMELLPAASATSDALDLSADVERFRASGQRWREALALARLALMARARGDAAAERARLLEARAAAAIAKVPAANVVRSMLEAPAAAAKAIVVGADARSLTLPNGEAHDLTRHGPVRRILWALARLRLDAPGTAMPTLAIIEAGWPGEKMQHEAATLRVYTTIRRLRGFGLGDVLVTRDDGYLLDPDVPLTVGST